MIVFSVLDVTTRCSFVSVTIFNKDTITLHSSSPLIQLESSLISLFVSSLFIYLFVLFLSLSLSLSPLLLSFLAKSPIQTANLPSLEKC